jgi:hypothetical protein
MTRRMLASVGTATILATVLLATPVGAQVTPSMQPGEGGQDDLSSDACLAPAPHAVFGTGASLGVSNAEGFGRRRPIPSGARRGALAFARTELFFGTDKPGDPVTDEEFRAFLDDQITPRFPDGLTVIKGDGQFRDSQGDIIKEASFILVLLYPIESVTVSHRRIERIRECYLRQFQQESVLRADQPFASWVYF